MCTDFAGSLVPVYCLGAFMKHGSTKLLSGWPVFGWLYCKCSNCGLHFKEDLFMTACVTYFYKLQHDKDMSAKQWMLMPKNEHVYISKYFC